MSGRMRKYANQSTKLGRFLARNGGNIWGGLWREIFTKLYLRPRFRRLIAPWFRVREPRTWLFLVGCYNSGTTILRDILQAHPDVSGLPFEGVKFTSAFPDLERQDWPRMMYRFRDDWDLADERADDVVARAKRDWAPWWRRGALVFLEKSIDHSTRIAWLDRHFGDTAFIGIIRNGYAVSEGVLRRSRPGPDAVRELGQETYPLDDVGQQWRVFADRIEHDLGQVQNGLLLRYETLMHDPVTTMSQVYGFLGLPIPKMSFADGVLDVEGTRFRLENQDQIAIARLTPLQKTGLAQAMSPTIDRFEYHV